MSEAGTRRRTERREYTRCRFGLDSDPFVFEHLSLFGYSFRSRWVHEYRACNPMCPDRNDTFRGRMSSLGPEGESSSFPSRSRVGWTNPTTPLISHLTRTLRTGHVTDDVSFGCQGYRYQCLLRITNRPRTHLFCFDLGLDNLRLHTGPRAVRSLDGTRRRS